MMRPVTFVMLLMAAGSGLYLYQTKHQAQMLDREIARTLKAADTARQHAALMRAEYTLLNDPSRLADLAAALLPELQTTNPAQFAAWSDLDRRLPPVGPPPSPAGTPAAPDALTPDAVTPDAVRRGLVAAQPPRPSANITASAAAAPVQSATIQPASVQSAPVQPVAFQPPVPPAPPHPAPPPPRMAAQASQPAPPARRVAEPVAPHPPHAPAIAAAPRPSTGGSLLAAARPAPVAVTPVAARAPTVAHAPSAPPASTSEAIARIARGGRVDPSVPAVASALGMARTMVPSAISSAQAASWESRQ